MSVEMKNLTINDTTFEVVDDKARSEISELKGDLDDIQNAVDLSNVQGTNEIMYIRGETEPANTHFLSAPIFLNKGEIIKLKCFMWSNIQATLFTCTKNGSFIQEIGVGAQTIKEYSYRADNDIYVRYGYQIDKGVSVYKYSEIISSHNAQEYLKESYGLRNINTMFTNEIVYHNETLGFYTESYNKAVLSSPIRLKAGEEIHVMAKLDNNSQVTLVKCNQDGTFVEILGVGKNNIYEYTYYAKEDLYVRYCSSSDNYSAYIVKRENIYHVGKDREFTSFIDCLKSLMYKQEEKIIYVDAGVYDLFEEIGGNSYANSISPNAHWEDCNVFVPSNTKIIGLGNVIFNFRPTIEQIGNVADKLLSPINVSGDLYMENITINAENCRYCIHDDVSLHSEYANCVHEYVNVRLNKFYNDGVGMSQALGGGIGYNQKMIFRNCVMTAPINVFSYHDNSPTPKGSILLDGCAIYGGNWRSISFTNVHPQADGHIDVKIINCYTDKDIVIASETNTPVGNNFDVMVIKTGVDVKKDDLVSDNYTPIVLN